MASRFRISRLSVRDLVPDYALWYGWSEMRQDLTEIKRMAQELRKGKK